MTRADIIFITWIVTAIVTVPVVSYLYAQNKIDHHDAPLYLISGIFPPFGVIFLCMMLLDKYVVYINRIRDEKIEKEILRQHEARQLQKSQERNFIAEATREVDDLLRLPGDSN